MTSPKVAVGVGPARSRSASRYVYMGGILSLMANVAELRAGDGLFEAEGATNRITATRKALAYAH